MAVIVSIAAIVPIIVVVLQNTLLILKATSVAKLQGDYALVRVVAALGGCEGWGNVTGLGLLA